MVVKQNVNPLLKRDYVVSIISANEFKMQILNETALSCRDLNKIEIKDDS